MDGWADDNTPTLAAAKANFPPASWPTKDQLDYARLAMTVFLLALGTTWVVYMLFKSPGKVFAGAGRQHIKGVS